MTQSIRAVAGQGCSPTKGAAVASLLAEAAKNGGIVISRRELRRYQGLSVVELRKALVKAVDHEPGCLSIPVREILLEEQAGELGHAPAWLEAGARYEELIAALESQGPAEYVFCLDPWAAQLLGSRDGAGLGARWVFVRDEATREREQLREYWEQLDHWFGNIPYHAIISREELERSIRDESPVGTPGGDDRIILQKPGSWQWRQISKPSRRSPRPTGALLLIVRYSGSLSHLRVLLDSLARQDYPKHLLRLAILAAEPCPDVKSYLKWYSHCHPSQGPSLVDISDPDQGKWRADLNRVLAQSSGAVIVLVGDHSILPDKFSRKAVEISSADPRPVIFGVPLGDQASAHILIGNLDPIPNYEILLRTASSGTASERSEVARILSPAEWASGNGDPLSKIMAPESGGSESREGLGLLQLASEK